jgi:hypothetical protein
VTSSTPRPLYSRGKSPSTHWIGSWVNPRTGLDGVKKRNILHTLEIALLRSAVQPVASRCTDCAIPALNIMNILMKPYFIYYDSKMWNEKIRQFRRISGFHAQIQIFRILCTPLVLWPCDCALPSSFAARFVSSNLPFLCSGWFNYDCIVRSHESMFKSGALNSKIHSQLALPSCFYRFSLAVEPQKQRDIWGNIRGPRRG